MGKAAIKRCHTIDLCYREAVSLHNPPKGALLGPGYLFNSCRDLLEADSVENPPMITSLECQVGGFDRTRNSLSLDKNSSDSPSSLLSSDTKRSDRGACPRDTASSLLPKSL